MLVSSLSQLERFHDCATFHFSQQRSGDECDGGNTARGFSYSYPMGMSIKIREICGSRRCRATLLCIRPSRFMRKSWLVRLRLHPTPKKRDPKSVSCAFNHVRGASSFVVVSFRNTICELATDNSGAVSLCYVLL